LFFPEKFLISKFSATDEKQVLKAFAIAKGLLDNLSFIFIVDILLLVVVVVVVVLTVFQVVLDVLEFKKFFCQHNDNRQDSTIFLLVFFEVRIITVSVG